MADKIYDVGRFRHSIDNWQLSMLLGIIFFIVGIVVFFEPGGTYLALSVLFGIVVILSGAFELYLGTKAPTGSGKGWYIAGPATANTFAYQVYDNEPLSYFISSKPGASVTVDFGKVVTIDNFMYMPRNDDNFVRIGDCYELFYWGEGCWNSLGKKMAEKPFLPYDGIPSGALLYLHDSTRGEEELIFHMEDGKQVFVSDCKD